MFRVQTKLCMCGLLWGNSNYNDMELMDGDVLMVMSRVFRGDVEVSEGKDRVSEVY